MRGHGNTLRTSPETFARARAAVFRIRVPPRRPESGNSSPSADDHGWFGSGFFISASGYALTAFHNLPDEAADSGPGDVQGTDVQGRLHRFEYIPMSGDEELDIALLKACDGGPHPHLPIAALPDDLSDAERWRQLSHRAVHVLGFPVQGGVQVEKWIACHLQGSHPFGLVAEEAGGVSLQVERLRLVPDESDELGGISGGPVVDVATGLVVAVLGAKLRHQNLLFASAVRRWPEDVSGHALPPVGVLQTQRGFSWAWTAAALAMVVGLAAAAVFLAGRFAGGQRSTPPPQQAASPPIVPEPQVSDVRDEVAAEVATVVAPSETTVCDVTVTTTLPYDEFGGPHTCGYEISGTVTPASSQPRDVMLFVTAGRDASVTRLQGRVTVAAGQSAWALSTCQGKEYSVVVATPDTLRGLEASVASVPGVGLQGVSCVRTFAGVRLP